MDCGVKEVAIFGAASESFSRWENVVEVFIVLFHKNQYRIHNPQRRLFGFTTPPPHLPNLPEISI